MSQHCYDLNGIVVHHGQGMSYGHYWSLARSSCDGYPKWIEFDDNKTQVVEDKEIQRYYGATADCSNVSAAGWSTAYMLLY